MGFITRIQTGLKETALVINWMFLGLGCETASRGAGRRSEIILCSIMSDISRLEHVFLGGPYPSLRKTAKKEASCQLVLVAAALLRI